MKSLMSLWSCAATEMAARCCTSADLDVKYVEARVKHEGLSFFAITLADLGKATQKWLDQGFVVSSDCSAFRANRRTGLPLFLGGFLRRVFDPASGALLDDPCVESIYAIRQLTLMFSKIALPGNTREGVPTGVVSPGRERQAMHDYLQCEAEVRQYDSLLDPSYLDDFKRVSSLLFSDWFQKVDRDVYWNRLRGRHGPGTVADRLSSNAKWSQRTWTSRLESVLPASDYLYANERSYLLGKHSDITFNEPDTEVPVRVHAVPKTLKTPRIIAMEPACMQYAQQALYRGFVDALLEDDFLSGIIGIHDQDPNRDLACRGSHSGDLATLDLSEASDRVSNQHVLALFEDYPHLTAAVQASRSRKADVPGHGVQRLSKFASMGSALCFPVEAMVFTTLIFLGIERELSAPLSLETVNQFRGQVRVFGDDLIVPRDYVLSVVDELSTFGYKVNISKSFWTGRFRESCGREYYDGHDVSIVKCRQLLPTQRQDATGVIAAVKFRNLAYWAGLWKTAAWLDSYLGKVLKMDLPNVAPTSPVLGRESALGYQFQRLHPDYHSPLVKGYKVVANPPSDELAGEGALLKCLSMKPWEDRRFSYPLKGTYFNEPIVDTRHLERSGRPERVSIKLGWGSPF